MSREGVVTFRSSLQHDGNTRALGNTAAAAAAAAQHRARTSPRLNSEQRRSSGGGNPGPSALRMDTGAPPLPNGMRDVAAGTTSSRASGSSSKRSHGTLAPFPAAFKSGPPPPPRLRCRCSPADSYYLYPLFLGRSSDRGNGGSRDAPAEHARTHAPPATPLCFFLSSYEKKKKGGRRTAR